MNNGIVICKYLADVAGICEYPIPYKNLDALVPAQFLRHGRDKIVSPISILFFLDSIL